MERISRRTADRIEALTRPFEIGGHGLVFCPCRVLPETVLALKTVMREIARLWGETLGEDVLSALLGTREGADFFQGTVRLVQVQAGRPDMAGVWFAVPPDYPRRVKVQLIDMFEPYEFPWIEEDPAPHDGLGPAPEIMD